eukprot:5894341-Prymnesium_polylepis.3
MRLSGSTVQLCTELRLHSTTLDRSQRGVSTNVLLQRQYLANPTEACRRPTHSRVSGRGASGRGALCAHAGFCVHIKLRTPSMYDYVHGTQYTRRLAGPNLTVSLHMCARRSKSSTASAPSACARRDGMAGIQRTRNRM